MNSITNLFLHLLLLTSILKHITHAVETSIHRLERQDLLYIRDNFTSNQNLHSNWTGPSCYQSRSRWFGITCTRDARVSTINLTGIGLTGILTPTMFQNLIKLTSIDISYNFLHGSLPNLRNSTGLRSISFSKNRLSGTIPLEYTKFPHLDKVYVDNNLLNGTIPPFNQTSLRKFDVSNNFLKGRIPETAAMQRFSEDSFEHNIGLCGKPLGSPCPEPGPKPEPTPPPGTGPGPKRASSMKKWVFWGLILLAVGAVLVPFILVFCYLCVCKLYHKDDASAKDSGDTSYDEFNVQKANKDSTKKLEKLEFVDKNKPVFNIDILLASSAEILGKGKLGATYRATLQESGPVVVTVKRLENMHEASKREFVHQIQQLGALKHQNILEIIAYHYTIDKKLVVYDNVDGVSLTQLLHENRGGVRVPLNWQARLTVARGIAKGLAYLHNSLPSQKVPHANLKLSNILINQNYNTKLTDYGFLPLLSPQHARRLAVGRTPEFLQGKRLGRKADVYCLGLVLMEIITGNSPENCEDEDLPSWVDAVVSREWSTDVLDLEIMAERGRYDEMLKLMDVARQCTVMEPGKRPNVSVVVDMIEEIIAESGGRRS